MTKLNVIPPLLVAIMAAVEPAFAGVVGVPGPIVGAGLPVLAVLAGGYWLMRRFRDT